MPPKPKVLVVADSKPERDTLAQAFERRGFGAGTASSFELQFAAAHEQPDLILIDVGRLGAAQVAKLLGEEPLGSRLVLLSDRPWPELRDLAAKCNAVGYVCDPGKPEEIVPRVAAFLEHPEEPATPAGSRPQRLDFVALARESTRGQFVAACPFSFLVSSSKLVSRRDGPQTAGVLDAEILRAMYEGAEHTPRKPSVTALAIRNAAGAAQDKISVGRMSGADIVIEHATVSSLHAYFVRSAEGLQLTDAGSRNGTWVSGRLLAPNGPPSPVLESGENVRFGELEFTLLSPSAAWDMLRVNVK